MKTFTKFLLGIVFCGCNSVTASEDELQFNQFQALKKACQKDWIGYPAEVIRDLNPWTMAYVSDETLRELSLEKLCAYVWRLVKKQGHFNLLEEKAYFEPFQPAVLNPVVVQQGIVPPRWTNEKLEMLREATIKLQNFVKEAEDVTERWDQVCYEIRDYNYIEALNKEFPKNEVKKIDDIRSFLKGTGTTKFLLGAVKDYLLRLQTFTEKQKQAA